MIPTIIVLFGAGYSWITLHEIEERDANPIAIGVYGQQFTWNFTYPGDKYSQGVLHVPVDRQIIFKMTSLDVIHSWWVPEWRIKKDTVPGIVTTEVVTPNRTGAYQGVCAELCGVGHATMRAKVAVEPERAYRRWLSKQQPVPPHLRGGPSAVADGDAPTTTSAGT